MLVFLNATSTAGFQKVVCLEYASDKGQCQQSYSHGAG